MSVSVLKAKDIIKGFTVPEGQKTASQVLDLGGINPANLTVMQRLGKAQNPPVKVKPHGPTKIKISRRA